MTEKALKIKRLAKSGVLHIMAMALFLTFAAYASGFFMWSLQNFVLFMKGSMCCG